MKNRLICAFFLVCVVIGFTLTSSHAQEIPFRRGDVNADSRADVSDAVFALLYLAGGGPEPGCLDAADVNDDGELNVSDPVAILDSIFTGGVAPAPPFPGCGTDPTPDALSCGFYPLCLTSRPAPSGRQEPAKDDLDADGVFRAGHVVLPSGEVQLDRTDLEIPGRGEVHFSLRRRYRSRLDYDGPLGFGWDFRLGERLYFEENGDVTRSNGRGHQDRWGRQTDGSYAAPAGQFRQLIHRPDDTFVLRSPSGFKRRYDAGGRLTSYEDRYGNLMSFHYDASGNLDLVVDPYGREIDFVFAAQGDGRERLVSVIDFAGREVAYRYDQDGNLISVRTPIVAGTSTGNDFPEGRVERYEYSSGESRRELDHNLLTVTYPQEVAEGGPPALTFTYGTDPASRLTFDRVLAEMEGGTNASGVPAGGAWLFSYENLPDGGTRATVTERTGNVSEVTFDASASQVIHRRLTRGLREGEPDSYDILSFYNADHLLVRRVFPEMNEIVVAYDGDGPRAAHRDILELRFVPGPRGGGEDIAHTFTYEPLYHQMMTWTEPRGNATMFDPPLGVASAERYTTRSFFDYQEGVAPIPEASEFGIDLSSVPRDLGDLNGDGRVDRMDGNAVRRNWHSVELLPGSSEAARQGGTTQEVVSEFQWNDRGQPTRIIDPEGNVTDLTYYPENDPDGDGLVNDSTFVELTTEPNGYQRSRTRDAATSPRRTATSAPIALEERWEYDAVGNITAVRNPRGIVTRLEVNDLNEVVTITRGADVSAAVASGDLLLETDPLAYLLRFTYDHNGRPVLSEVENRDSTTPGVGEFVEKALVFDILGRTVSGSLEVDADTRAVYQFRYDENENLTVYQKPEGNRVEISYDERNFPFLVTLGAGTPEAATARRDYDRNGNLTRLVDAEDNDGDGSGDSTTVEYDGFDRPIVCTDPLGNRLETTYDMTSNIIRRRFFGHPPARPGEAPVLLSDITLDHDELSRIFRIEQQLFVGAGVTTDRGVDLRDGDGDGVVRFLLEYDALSRPTCRVEDDGQVTRSVYDGASRMIESIDAAGNRRTIEYDRNSNPVAMSTFEVSTNSIVNGGEYFTFFVWDQLDRRVRVQADHTTRYGYDSRDNIIEISDAQGEEVADPLGFFPGRSNSPGNTRTFTYDGRDLLTAVIADLRVDGEGGGPLDTTNPRNADGRIEMRYRYDLNSRRAAVMDDNGNSTTFTFDALDRPIEKRHADGARHAFTYDRDGNMTSVVDPNGSRITQVHDALDRLVSREVAPGPGVVGTTGESFEYDGMGRLVAATDNNGAAARTHRFDRAYDSLSHVLEETQDSSVQSTVWSGDSRIEALIYPGGRRIGCEYDEIDRSLRTFEGETDIAASEWVGPTRRLLRRTHGNGSRLTFLNDDGDQDTGYDEFLRAKRLRHQLGESAFVDRTYEYNRADQRVSEERSDDGGATDSYTYDSTYRIVESNYQAGAIPRALLSSGYLLDGVGNRREEAAGDGGASLSRPYEVNEVNEYTRRGAAARSHDANGNLTGDGTFVHSYDWRNRLVAVDDTATGAPVALYEYDSLSRRVKKTVFDVGRPGTVVRETRYLYDDYFRVVEERGSAGTEVTYVYGEGIDEPIQMVRTALAPEGAGVFYLHQNARGDVVAVTDGSGTVVESTVYDDFGRPYQSSSVGNPYLFQGRRYDAETGLYYFRNRYYDPATGRFLQRDPVWDPVNVGNQYTFVGCGPASRGDPMGLLFGLFEDDKSKPRRPTLTWGELWGGFCDSLTQDSWAAKAYKAESKHLEDVATLYFEQDKGIFKTTVLTGSKLLSDFFGTTALYESIDGDDLDQFVSSGNIRELTTFERVLKFVGGSLQLVGSVFQISSAFRGVQAWALELRAASAATTELTASTRVAVSAHGQWLGRVFRLPRSGNVTVRFHEKLGASLADEVGQQIDVAVQFGADFVGANPRVYTSGQLVPEHLLSRADDLLIWIGDRVLKPPAGSPKLLSQWIDEIIAANPGQSILIEFSACRNASLLTQAKQAIGNFFSSMGQAYNMLDVLFPDKVRPRTEPEPEPEPEPLVAVPDMYSVAPGVDSILCLGENDKGTEGATFMLVGDPPLHKDAFEFDTDGKVRITLLTFGGPATFQYKVVRGDETSETVTVTVSPDAKLLYQLEPRTGLDGGMVVDVPCLILGGLHYPIYQFILSNNPPDVCKEPHWHSFGMVFPLEAPQAGISDPDQPRCGYGKLKDVLQAIVPFPVDKWQQFLIDHIPPI